MNRKQCFYLVWCFWICLSACNRNSNELPPLANSALQFSDSIVINGEEKLRLLFVQNKYPANDTIYVVAKRLLNVSIPDTTTILLELCTGAYPSYSNCRIQLTADYIPDGSHDTLFRIYNEGITPNAANIHAGVLRYMLQHDTIRHPLAGVYGSAASYADFIQDALYKYTGFARGYVLYDGSSTFHLKAMDTTEYDITGRFPPKALAFEGLLTQKGSLVTSVTYDLVNIDATHKLPADTTGGNLRDSLQLRHPLVDGVNHINLYLKK